MPGKPLVVAKMKCPRCGGGMIIVAACCAMRRKGWRTMAKCPSSKCGQRIPYEKH